MSAELEQRVLRKITLRIVPFVMLLYFIAFIDRVNVGFAALTMNKDLSLSPSVFGFGAGIFFLGYLIFQVPANLILERFGARRWVFLMLAVWGVVSASNAIISGPLSYYAMRLVLGVAEAGF